MDDSNPAECSGVDVLLHVATFGRLFTEELEQVAPEPELVNNNPMIILALLHQHGPLRPVDVQQHTRMTSGGMTNALNRLERQGLVQRRHDLADTGADGRAVYVAVTDAGSELVKELGRRLVCRLADLDTFARSGLRFIASLTAAMVSDCPDAADHEPTGGGH